MLGSDLWSFHLQVVPLLWFEFIWLRDQKTLLCNLENVCIIWRGTEGEVHFRIDALSIWRTGTKTEQIGHVAYQHNYLSAYSYLCDFAAYVLKVLILHVQHQGFVAVGVDKRGRCLLHRYEPLILGHFKNWMEIVHCQNSYLNCRNRVLPGVVVLVSLVTKPRTKKVEDSTLAIDTSHESYNAGSQCRKSYHDF